MLVLVLGRPIMAAAIWRGDSPPVYNGGLMYALSVESAGDARKGDDMPKNTSFPIIPFAPVPGELKLRAMGESEASWADK